MGTVGGHGRGAEATEHLPSHCVPHTCREHSILAGVIPHWDLGPLDQPLPRAAQDLCQALSRSTGGVLDPAALRAELRAQSLSGAPRSLLASVFLFHKGAGASSAQSAGGTSRLG